MRRTCYRTAVRQLCTCANEPVSDGEAGPRTAKRSILLLALVQHRLLDTLHLIEREGRRLFRQHRLHQRGNRKRERAQRDRDRAGGPGADPSPPAVAAGSSNRERPESRPRPHPPHRPVPRETPRDSKLLCRRGLRRDARYRLADWPHRGRAGVSWKAAGDGKTSTETRRLVRATEVVT